MEGIESHHPLLDSWTLAGALRAHDSQTKVADMGLERLRVLIVGGARSGIAAAKFMSGRGAQVTLSDSRPASELGEAQTLEVRLETGGHVRETFLNQDLIVVSPGVPWNMEHLVAARDAGITVIGEAELAAR